jgi:hypothetical protein
MINHDYYYHIGKNHQFCQDYVTQGEQFIALSDGCSSSPNTDIGARILSSLAKKIIMYPENDYQAFGQFVSIEAQNVVELMNLEKTVLDATLLVAFLNQKVVHIYMYGDGCILLKEHNGKIGYIDISFTNNMPYYLSYWNDKPRQQGYAEYSGRANTLRITNSLQSNVSLIQFNKPLSFSFSLEKYAVIAITSDGVTEFLDTQHNLKLPLRSVAENLLDFKNYNGEFVKRRMSKVIQRYAKQNIFPLDDVSLGAFIWR